VLTFERPRLCFERNSSTAKKKGAGKAEKKRKAGASHNATQKAPKRSAIGKERSSFRWSDPIQRKPVFESKSDSPFLQWTIAFKKHEFLKESPSL
jgi:hypothetical protein